MTGAEVKKMIMDNGIRLWAVAEQLGVSDNYFSRRMRGTFDDSEVEKIKSAIEKNESEKEICIHKEELEEGQFTNSKIIQTKDSINLLETTKKGTNSTDQSKVTVIIQNDNP